MRDGSHVTSASTLVEDGRPPRIAVTLELVDGRRVTYRLTPAIAFSVADALARQALRLEPKLARALEEAVAAQRRRELLDDGSGFADGLER